MAGMTPSQAHDFLQTVDWKATLTMSVPRFLRSYEAVKVDGTQGTLLSMAGRRGPGLHADLGQEWHRLFADRLRGFQPGRRSGGLAQVRQETRRCPSRIASRFKRSICARFSGTRSRCATSR